MTTESPENCFKQKTLIQQNLIISDSSKTRSQTIKPNQLLQSMVEFTKIMNQKGKQLKQLLAKRQKIHQKVFSLNDQIQLQKIFLAYQFWKHFGSSFCQNKEKNVWKIVAEEKKIYFGQIKNHKKEGKGITVYEDGRIYEGYYLQNEKHGFGVQSYPNGNIYEGNFDHNKKHDKGDMYWFNLGKNDTLQFYSGQWFSGLPFGYGKHQRSNGDFYEGFFKNGLKHGQGQQFYANGGHYKGCFLNGLPEGQGQYTWPNGDVYNGSFKQGSRFGFGRWKNSSNSQHYEGQYLFDTKSGFGILKESNKNIYQGNFLNDTFHGIGELKNGEKVLYKGQWQNGKPKLSTKDNDFLNQSKTSRSMLENLGFNDENPEKLYQKKESDKEFLKTDYQTVETYASKLINNEQFFQKHHRKTETGVTISDNLRLRKSLSTNCKLHTEANINGSGKKLGEIKKLSCLKMDVKSSQKNLRKLKITQHEHHQKILYSKVQSKSNIAIFPWQKRGQKMLQKLKLKEKK